MVKSSDVEQLDREQLHARDHAEKSGDATKVHILPKAAAAI